MDIPIFLSFAFSGGFPKLKASLRTQDYDIVRAVNENRLYYVSGLSTYSQPMTTSISAAVANLQQQ